jgi:hypothetical protein
MKTIIILSFIMGFSWPSLATPYDIKIEKGRDIGEFDYLRKVLCGSIKTPNMNKLINIMDENYMPRLNEYEKEIYVQYRQEGWEQAEDKASHAISTSGKAGIPKFCADYDAKLSQIVSAIDQAMSVK